MTDQDTEAGFELVLDNKKLVIAFAVLIAFFCCFFVVGFIEGKRQGFREAAQATAEPSKASSVTPQAQAPKPADVDSGIKTSKEGSEEQPLDWYKNMSGREKELGIAQPTPAPTPAKKIPESAPPAERAAKIKPQVNAARPGPVTYSVQVGAYSKLKEAENKAHTLRSKGYDYRIESPHPPEQLFLLKVGKFASRSEAVAMQLRLRKSGFTSAFIKTN